MPEFIKVLILSVIQGLTEFIPVSSSGHLVLAKHFLGLKSQGLALEVALHVGTLLAVLVFYFKRIVFLLNDLMKWKEEGRRYALAVIAGSIPAGIVGVVFKQKLEAMGDSCLLVSCFIMVTGLILLSLRFVRRSDGKLSVWNALMIGVAQAFAVIPGISRSGATIVTARHLGVEPGKAAEFSMLLMLPAVGGATFLELIHDSAWKTLSVSPVDSGVGILVAAVVGYISIGLLVKMLSAEKLWLFGIYCLIVGLLSLAILL